MKDYFIRLLPWVADDQSLVGIGMENPGVRKPAPRQTANPLPGPGAPFLAPPTQDATPETLDLSTKRIKTTEVPGDRVVVEPPLDHGTKPSAYLVNHPVHAFCQLQFDLLQLGPHTLGD